SLPSVENCGVAMAFSGGSREASE
ncbi:hypothetical protein A2U01_0063790, partial [Trifolium medium]|nr:hypothetical protein [Trifolium medium]